MISYRPRGQMAAADSLDHRRQRRSNPRCQPWHGADPVIVSAQIMTALQVILS